MFTNLVARLAGRGQYLPLLIPHSTNTPLVQVIRVKPLRGLLLTSGFHAPVQLAWFDSLLRRAEPPQVWLVSIMNIQPVLDTQRVATGLYTSK